MLNWNSIDTVLLDMDGTLLDLHFDNYFWQTHLTQRYAELHRQPYPEVRQRLTEMFSRVAGTLDWYSLDFWSRELAVDIVQLKREVEHLIAVHPHAEDFLQRLQGKKRLILVTNAHRKSLQLKMERTGIARFFETIISSHDYLKPKEDMRFWQQLQQELKFDPARTLLVEDHIGILDTAHRFGIRHLLAISRPDSKGELRTIGRYPAIEHFGELLPFIE
ncbi:MAG TPA: GMP/IMP nucleotidase [Gammaproteobacteria bacterium]